MVKPTIKVIDYAMSGSRPEFPKKNNIYLLALLISFSVPLAFLYLKFLFDDKFHNKNQLLKLLNNEMPVIGEIPYVKNDNDLNNLINNNSRSPISESIRMIMANLKLSISLLASNNIKNNTITVLVTSSIKGEGKTIISSNISSLLSSNNKVLLIGADLRNPQIHKIIKKEKSVKGISDIIYKNDINNFQDYIIKQDNLDVLLSELFLLTQVRC